MKPWFEIELPTSPAMTGIIVGALAGIVVFLTVVALVSRRARPQATRISYAPPSYSYPPPASVIYRPTTALSARAFAKMGYAFGERVEGPISDPFEDDFAGPDPDETADPRPVSMAPNPLAVIPSSSNVLIPVSASSLKDLDYDDEKTEVSETFFDEPPQPLAPPPNVPQIRRVAPQGPRFVT